MRVVIAVVAGLAVAERRMERATLRLRHMHPGGRLAAAAAVLDGQRRQMDALSPARVLERGYAVVRRRDGQVVRWAGQVAAGDAVDVQLAAGRLAATVDEVTP